MFLSFKSCLCLTFALLSTGSSFGVARLFSSHQYPPPQTTSLYRLIGRQYWPLSWSTHSSEGLQQSGTATSEFEPTNLSSNYQPISYPVVNSGQDSSAFKSNGQSEDFMSILELAARQRFQPTSLTQSSFPNQQQQQQQYQDSAYVPHSQTKQHYHVYRGPQSIKLEQDEASNGEYQHQLEPIIYESGSSILGQSFGSNGAQEKFSGQPQQISDLGIYNLYNLQQQQGTQSLIK